MTKFERIMLDYCPLYVWWYWYRDSRKTINNRFDAIVRTVKMHRQGWF